MLADLRDAMRQLRKAPGFTTTALVTLALGIGATTAIFTLVHQVMLKSLPVAKPGELWRIGDKDRCCNWGGFTQGDDGDFALFSWEAYQHLRAHTPEFVDLAALQAGNASLGVRRAGSQAPVDTRNGEYVSGNFFRTLGIQPWIGRVLTDEDDKEGAPPVAVMSYRIWHDKYGSDTSVVGAGYQINGHPFTVIGVAPPGFFGAKLAGWGMPDFWLPVTTRLVIDGPTRGLKDRAQTSIRVALGASRARIVRKSLVECVMLSAIGGALGIAVAYAGTRLILHLAFQNNGPNNYVPISAAPSLSVLLFTLGVSVLTGIIFGIAPAWVTSHADPVEALRGANRSVGGGRSWAQKSLVIAQGAISVVLLSAAALLGQSLRNLEHQNFGFETHDRYIAWINPNLGNYKGEQMKRMIRHINDRVRQIPGVRMVTEALYAPMSGDSWNNGVHIEGRPEPPPKEDTSSGFARVTPDFFETIGANIVLGRPITDEDTASTRNVAVINEAFVKKFFKDQNPIGQHFGPGKVKYSAMYEIVGVVKDIRYMTWGMKEPVRPMYLLPEAQFAQWDDPAYASGDTASHFLDNIVIWAPGDPPGMEDRVRKALASVDPNLVLYNVDPYEKVVRGQFQQEKMIATLTSLFGVLGLILASVGLYGVLAYMVEQRTSEIGIRMALGANRGQVTKMVLAGAFFQIGIGLAIGIPAAIGAGRLMTTQLFGVKPWDPIMLALAVLVLGLAAVLASAIPARRAAGVEPMVALRNA